MASSQPSLHLPSLWQEYLCTQKVSKVLYRQGNIDQLDTCTETESNCCLVWIVKCNNMAMLGKNWNKLPKNCWETSRCQKTASVFEIFQPTKKGLQA